MINLRPYQAEAKDAVFEQWDSGKLKTLLVLPTGTGKTIVFAKITEALVKNGERVLILAHRGELLSQAADKLEKATLQTIEEDGIMTGDLAAMSTLPNAKKVDTEGFLLAIRDRLEQLL